MVSSLAMGKRQLIGMTISHGTDRFMDAEQKTAARKELEDFSVVRSGMSGEGADHTRLYTVAPRNLDPGHGMGKIAFPSLGLVETLWPIQGSADRYTIFPKQATEVIIQQPEVALDAKFLAMFIMLIRYREILSVPFFSRQMWITSMKSDFDLPFFRNSFSDPVHGFSKCLRLPNNAAIRAKATRILCLAG